METTAWRCSQCGTVNEPDARACRACGKWPSLFDLQDNAVPDEELERSFEVDEIRPETFEPETFEAEPFEPDVFGGEVEEVGDGQEPESPSRSRRWASFIVPIAIAIYVVVSIVFGDR